MEKRFVVSPQTVDYSITNIVEAIDKRNKLLAIDGIDDLSDEKRLDYSDSIILKPSYQRDYRSTTQDESSLVESIFLEAAMESGAEFGYCAWTSTCRAERAWS